VVPSKPNHALVVLSILCKGHEQCARWRVVWLCREQRVVQPLPVSLLDLLDRLCIVVWRHSYISAIDDPQPGGGKG